MDINTLKENYFVQPSDLDAASSIFPDLLPQELPRTFDNSRVTPLIDGENYFSELSNVLNMVGTGTPEENKDHFIYISGWFLDLLNGFSLDGLGGSPKFFDLLKTKSEAGVDVRIMASLNPYLKLAEENDLLSKTDQKDTRFLRFVGRKNIENIDAFRQISSMSQKCLLNIIGHPSASVHVKMIVIGTVDLAVGFTGGIDLVEDRYCSELFHTPVPAPGHPPTKNWWHDVQMKIEGPAVQGLYDYFKDMWKLILDYHKDKSIKKFRMVKEKEKAKGKEVPAQVPGTPEVPTRKLPSLPAGAHHVQSLRTVPQYKISFWSPGTDFSTFSFASDGAFEIAMAWKKAIAAAKQYIYIEDQYFWSSHVMEWINEAINHNPHLKVILLIGKKDPGDPKTPPHEKVALQDSLLGNLSNLQIEAQVRLYNVEYLVHSKTTLIDDRWAMIGSANCMRASLFTYYEHSVSVLDPDNELVQTYRMNLWGGHFGLNILEREILRDLNPSLALWDSGSQEWSSSLGPVPSLPIQLPANIKKSSLDSFLTSPVTLLPVEQRRYDQFTDVDSREVWSVWE